MAQNANSGAISHTDTDTLSYTSSVFFYPHADAATVEFGDPVAKCYGYSDPHSIRNTHPHPDSGADSDAYRYADTRTDPDTPARHRGHQ